MYGAPSSSIPPCLNGLSEPLLHKVRAVGREGSPRSVRKRSPPLATLDSLLVVVPNDGTPRSSHSSPFTLGRRSLGRQLAGSPTGGYSSPLNRSTLTTNNTFGGASAHSPSYASNLLRPRGSGGTRDSVATLGGGTVASPLTAHPLFNPLGSTTPTTTADTSPHAAAAVGVPNFSTAAAASPTERDALPFPNGGALAARTPSLFLRRKTSASNIGDVIPVSTPASSKATTPPTQPASAVLEPKEMTQLRDTRVTEHRKSSTDNSEGLRCMSLPFPSVISENTLPSPMTDHAQPQNNSITEALLPLALDISPRPPSDIPPTIGQTKRALMKATVPPIHGAACRTPTEEDKQISFAAKPRASPTSDPFAASPHNQQQRRSGASDQPLPHSPDRVKRKDCSLDDDARLMRMIQEAVKKADDDVMRLPQPSRDRASDVGSECNTPSPQGLSKAPGQAGGANVKFATDGLGNLLSELKLADERTTDDEDRRRCMVRHASVTYLNRSHSMQGVDAPAAPGGNDEDAKRGPDTEAPMGDHGTDRHDEATTPWHSSFRYTERSRKAFHKVCCGCFSHDKSTTGASYVRVGGKHTTYKGEGKLQITKEVMEAVGKARTLIHCLLEPSMDRAEVEDLMLQTHAALLCIVQLPSSQRFEVLLRAAPSWGIAEQVLTDLKGRYDKKDPRLKPRTILKARAMELYWMCDRSNTGDLTESEVRGLVKILNLNISNEKIVKLFREFDVGGRRVLGFKEFRALYDRLCERVELIPIFRDISAGRIEDGRTGGELTIKELHAFLTVLQGDGITEGRARDLVDEWDCLTFQGFSRYLTSEENTWWTAERRQHVYQDMTLPISHYYVCSSHNTYLSGDQLTSQSDEVMYKYALLRGCRCVEVDVWDGKDGQPTVTHGHTKTTRIPFRDVIKTISEYAFSTSEYPVIVSLENHCSPPQQRLMADIMKRTFGSKLLLPYPDDLPPEEELRIYTPAALKRRILLRGKDSAWGDPTTDTNPDPLGGTIAGPDHDTGTPVGPVDLGPRASLTSPFSPSKASTGGGACRELSSILFFRNNKLVGNSLDATGAVARPWQMLSLSETKAEKLIGSDLANLTKRLSVRVYPKATRFDSSNFEPAALWASGIQFVALNLQTPDFPTRLNHSKFEDNGGCGFLVKPLWLRDPEAAHHKATDMVVVEVMVLSGGNFPCNSKSLVDPFVEGFVSGAPVDDVARNQPQSTQPRVENGFNPVWAGEKLTFQVRVPELAVLTLRVMNGRNDAFITEASIPVESLRNGFRSVPMADAQGRYISGCFLLCRFKIKREPLSTFNRGSFTVSTPRSARRGRFNSFTMRNRTKSMRNSEQLANSLYPLPSTPNV